MNQGNAIFFLFQQATIIIIVHYQMGMIYIKMSDKMNSQLIKVVENVGQIQVQQRLDNNNIELHCRHHLQTTLEPNINKNSNMPQG